MFSSFGNIFITKPRQAENADTRLGIRHHEPDQERRKKEEKSEPVSVFDTDDSATVTVDALRAFLENFLKSMTAEKKDGGKFVAPEQPQAPQNSAPAHHDGAAARAAGAYQHVAKKVDRTQTPEVPADADATPLLGAADIRTIYKLIEDLKPLSERGIEYLTIERSDSFLNSLVAAVEKAKNL
jgi:hypothetical protein